MIESVGLGGRSIADIVSALIRTLVVYGADPNVQDGLERRFCTSWRNAPLPMRSI